MFSNRDYNVVPAQWTRGIKVGEQMPMVESGGGWVKLLVFLLVVAVLASLGLWFYKAKISSDADLVKQSIAQLEEQKSQLPVDKITNFAKKITVAKQLLSSHIYSSDLLGVIEKTTLPMVQWTNLSVDTKNNAFDLEGYAGDWNSVAKQIVALEKENLRVIAVSKLASARERGIGFSLKIGFSNSLLLKK